MDLHNYSITANINNDEYRMFFMRVMYTHNANQYITVQYLHFNFIFKQIRNIFQENIERKLVSHKS